MLEFYDVVELWFFWWPCMPNELPLWWSFGWVGGWARLLPSHFDKYASVGIPIIISLLCGGL